MIPDHGTLARYKGRGCRCERCKAANRDFMRAQRGTQHKGPAWGAVKLDYTMNPVYVPDTLTRGELLAARGY